MGWALDGVGRWRAIHDDEHGGWKKVAKVNLVSGIENAEWGGCDGGSGWKCPDNDSGSLAGDPFCGRQGACPVGGMHVGLGPGRAMPFGGLQGQRPPSHVARVVSFARLPHSGKPTRSDLLAVLRLSKSSACSYSIWTLYALGHWNHA